MELLQLKYFRDAAETENFSATAKNFGVPASDISQSIKRLEKELLGLGIPVKAYGPFEAPIYKSNGRYRKRIIIKCRLNNKLRDIFSQVYIDFAKSGDKTTLSVDFNPTNI